MPAGEMPLCHGTWGMEGSPQHPPPHLMVLQPLQQRSPDGHKGSDGRGDGPRRPASVLRTRRSGLGTQAWAESWKKRKKRFCWLQGFAPGRGEDLPGLPQR